MRGWVAGNQTNLEEPVPPTILVGHKSNRLTALGIDNYGRMTYRYGYEEIDFVDDTTDWVWNAPQHVFFLRLRKLFDAELCDLYTRLESLGCWSATSLINQFYDWQMQFPEELWRIDIERKYIRTFTTSYINGKAYPEFLRERANGRKMGQREQFETNQEKYMSSKFGGTVASSDDIILRCSVPSGELAVQPNFDIALIPYAYIYLNVKYNTSPPIRVRAVPGQSYTIKYDAELADIIEIYSASCLKYIGDLSKLYLTNGTFANADKVRELILGSDEEGYNNTNVMTLGLGNNDLLEKLNIENMSGLTHALDFSALKNLKELYAHGSSVSGVTFANGGLIEIIELPPINSMTMRNLMYLATLDIVSFDKLTSITVENCNTIDLINIFENASNINRVRIIGVDWDLDSTDLLERIYKMSGIDRNGYNTDQSVLSGTVRVPVVGQQELYKYQKAWTDLTIIPNTITQQFKVEFQNDDGTILDTQYVAIGKDAVDPVTRNENPIAVPEKESTIENDFTYAGWDSPLTAVFADRVIKATYTASLRRYTVRYVSKGTVLQETAGLYGDNIQYTGNTPTYTLEESAYKYYLFDRWDNSGFLTGDKVINAIFDSFQYTEGYFADKELSDLKPVEIYALTKLGLDNVQHQIVDGDMYSFSLGYDVDYDDIVSEVIIDEKTVFNGNSYIDTGVKLFDVDRDFVLAIDFKVDNTNKLNNVIAQCFQSNGANGFKIWYNGGAKLTWGTSTTDVAGANKREMVVIRHKKGDNNLTVYSSNLDGSESITTMLARNKITSADSTLVFGSAKADDGAFENYASGTVYWCKVWYQDLGGSACEKLVGWTHENVSMEVCGFKKYYLAENASKRCSFTLLATHLLDRTRPFKLGNTNAGGWALSSLNIFLNTRLYTAMSEQLKSLIKQVTVPSSAGNMSTEITTSSCYVTIPSLVEVSNENPANEEPYIYEGTTISYMISPAVRKRAFVDGDYANYWLRSPNIGYTTYIYQVDDNGNTYGFSNPGYASGILIEISF